MAEKDYRVLSDLAQIAPYAALAVDTEGDSLNKMRARLSGISFCGEPCRAFWLPAEAIDAPKLQQMLPAKAARVPPREVRFDDPRTARHRPRRRGDFRHAHRSPPARRNRPEVTQTGSRGICSTRKPLTSPTSIN